MRKLAAALLLLISFPLVATALTQQELQAQIATLLAQLATIQQQIQSQTQTTNTTPVSTSAGASAICSVTRYPLKRGDNGEDVRKLQIFLVNQGMLATEPTGYFGQLTEKALTQFQLNAGIITSASQGGVFGPKTFQYVLNHFCITTSLTPPPGPTPPPTTQQCVPPPQPNLSCSGQWLRIFSATGCHTGWTCSQSATSTSQTSPTNRPPMISALTGLTQLKPGENGTWTVTATDPDNDPLLYSMVFGDEGATMAQLLNIAEEGTPYSASRSFVHAYQ